MTSNHRPTARGDFLRLLALLNSQEPFTFIRFSDGEMEVLRNRYLEIGEGYTVFKGRNIQSKFPVFDKKLFDPELHADFRAHLMQSATRNDRNFFKGVPATHNGMQEDRDYMIALNGGLSLYMTFADLFLNRNYASFRRHFVPALCRQPSIAVIANHRAALSPRLAHATHIPVSDNFISNYFEERERVLGRVRELPLGTLVLSSASSLSNILGDVLFEDRKDLTFIDIGTSMNDMLGLQGVTRAYHRARLPRNLLDVAFAVRYRLTREYWIRW